MPVHSPQQIISQFQGPLSNSILKNSHFVIVHKIKGLQTHINILASNKVTLENYPLYYLQYYLLQLEKRIISYPFIDRISPGFHLIAYNAA